MPAVAVCTVDQIVTGHACSTTAGIQGALVSKVTIGGNPIAVRGDAIAPHTILSSGSCVPHTASINAGSGKVFAEGIAVARIGDSADAGAIISGSSSVFAGG
jgi:uncharacterized Zn-binding protein involved in type VI secretion